MKINVDYAARFIGKLAKMEGSAGKVTLSKTQLEALGENHQNLGEVIRKLTKNLTDPKLDVAYKAESNYAIAGLRLRDGRKVVGQGAASISNPGSSEAVVKYRASVNGGQSLQVNGFVDGGKVADTRDIAMSMSRKGGRVTTDASVSNAMQHHLEFNENQAVELAKEFDANNILRQYARVTNKFQKEADGLMVVLRKIMRGEAYTPNTPMIKTGPFPKLADKEITELEKLKLSKLYPNKKISLEELDTSKEKIKEIFNEYRKA